MSEHRLLKTSGREGMGRGGVTLGRGGDYKRGQAFREQDHS